MKKNKPIERIIYDIAKPKAISVVISVANANEPGPVVDKNTTIYKIVTITIASIILKYKSTAIIATSTV